MIRIILKNMDKKNYGIYGGSMALFSMVTYVISSLIFINDQVNLGMDSENIRIIFSFYYVVILIVGVLFVLYALNFYIKSRMKDYSIYVTLGTSKKKALSIMLLEYASIFAVGLIVGLIFGLIVVGVISTVFSLSGSPVSLLLKDIICCVSFSVMLSFGIFILGSVSGTLIFLRKDITKIMNAGVKGEKRYHWLCVLLAFGILILFKSICLLERKEFEFILLSIIMNFVGIYILLSFGLSFGFSLIQRFKNVYIKNMLVIRNFLFRYKSNRMIAFLSYMLNVIVIFFAGGMIITSYVDADPGTNTTVILISSYFIAAFTVVCNMGILGIKQLCDRKNIREWTEILGYLGMDNKCRKNYSIAEFRMLVVISAVLSNFFVWLYILAECERVHLLNAEHILGFSAFQVVLITIQYGYYVTIKQFLIRSI